MAVTLEDTWNINIKKKILLSSAKKNKYYSSSLYFYHMCLAPLIGPRDPFAELSFSQFKQLTPVQKKSTVL